MASREFTTTRWSQVLKARDQRAEDAMAYLCSSYWRPLYLFARRQGHDEDRAQDLTQTFFTGMLEGRYLKSVKQDRGRFRSFLLACFKHFLAHEWQKVRALKRGGGVQFSPLEGLGDGDPADQSLTPEQAYDRQWAVTLLQRVIEDLEQRYREMGRGPLFEALKPALTGGSLTHPAAVAASLGLTEGALRVATHRLRRRYRDELRRQVAETLAGDESISDELAHLCAVL